MPCYSRVETKITNAERLAESLRELGYGAAVVEQGALRVSVNGRPLFSRQSITEPFASVKYQSNIGPQEAAAIGRKYAGLGVRAFAKKRGFAVASDDGAKIVLKNRGGF